MKITHEKAAPRLFAATAKAFDEYIPRAIYMQKLFHGERLNQRTELGVREFMTRGTWK